MKLNYKKSLKLITLLITSLLIATVSAQIYNYMYISGSGEITATGLKWELGADIPPGALITGPTATVALTTNGNPRNYTDCLHVVNLDPTTDHSFNITVTSSPSSTANKANFTKFNLVLFDDLGAQKAVLNLKTQGSGATLLSIQGGKTWRVLFELVPIASPTTGAKVDFQVTLVYV